MSSGVLASIGKAIRAAVDGTNGKPSGSVEKIEIPGYIDTLVGGVTAVQAAFSNTAVLSAIKADIDAADTNDVKVIFKQYSMGLPTRTTAGKQPFAQIATAAGSLLSNLNDIRKNFDTVFGPASDPTLSFDDMKVSTAIAFGFLEKTENFIKWATFLLDHVGPQSTTKPPYQMAWLLKSTPVMAKWVQTLISPSAKTLIMRDITKIKNSGNDTYLSSDGSTIDDYSQDSAFTQDELAALSGFMRSPAMMIGAFLAERRDKRYRVNREMQEWINARMSMLIMKQQRVSPDSPEYKRLDTILKKYQEERAKYDREIARYEDTSV